MYFIINTSYKIHMEFELAQAAAERLGVGVRTIQKWAKEGKLPGAIKVGRDWQIPIGVAGPNDTTQAANNDAITLRMPMPLLNSAFPIGGCLQYIENMTDPDDRNLALAEYYFYNGHAETAAKISGSLLEHTDPMIKYSADFINGMANVSCNHMHLARFAINMMKEHLIATRAEHVIPQEDRQKDSFYTKKDEYDQADKILKVDRSNLGEEQISELKALGVFTVLAGKVLFQFPAPEIPNIQEKICYLPEGYRLFACYLLANKAYAEKDYGRCLGIADTALVITHKTYPIAEIFIHLIAAVALMSMMKIEEAKKRFSKAWDMARPDHLLEPFVVHHAMLHGLIEVMLKKDYPAEYQQIVDAAHHFRIGWVKIHSPNLDHDGSNSLTTTEFTIAKLYNRGWTVKEIAFHMDMSERTVNNRIQVIYAKLGITSKKELMQFMLH